MLFDLCVVCLPSGRNDTLANLLSYQNPGRALRACSAAVVPSAEGEIPTGEAVEPGTTSQPDEAFRIGRRFVYA